MFHPAHDLADLRLLPTIATDAEGFVATLKSLPKTLPQYQNFILASARSFENVFEVLTALADLAGLLSLFIKKFSMNREINSEHVLRRGKEETAALEASPGARETSNAKALPEGNAGGEDK